MTVTIKAGNEPIPGYRLESRLGSGTFGEVWRARAPGGTQVALKFLQLSGRHGAKEFRAIQRVKQIRHPNLMPITQIWLIDDDGEVISDDLTGTWSNEINDTVAEPCKETLVIDPVRESRRPALLVVGNLLADKTLTDRLHECQAEGRTGIPPLELLGYMDEAAKGLDHLNSKLHQIGDSVGAVQHCDVKPDNIVLTGGSAVVTDFGVAQMLAEAGSGATATSLGGTPAYMAPECFSAKTSPSTDQYALAVTYFELRAGVLPFEEQTYAAVYEAHKSGTLDFSAVPQREQAVLRKATSPDPTRRFHCCVEFVHALREAVSPTPLGARPTGKWHLAAATAAVTGTIAVVILAFIALRGAGSDALDFIIQDVQAGKYASAVSPVAKLDDAEHVKQAVAAIEEGLKNEKRLDDDVSAASINLVAYLQQSDWDGELKPAEYASVSQRIADALSERLDTIRALCDQWDPQGENEPPPAALAEGVTKFAELLAAGMPSGGEVAECVRVQPKFELQRIRKEAREGRSKWPALREPLGKIDEAALSAVDAPYVGALRFIFEEPAGASPGPGEIAARLRAYREFRAKFADVEPADWELMHALAQLKSLNDAIPLEWLSASGDRDFVTLVASFSEAELPLAKAAKNSAELSLKQAQRDRLANAFPEARTSLAAALNAGPVDARLARDIRDEQLAVDLVDPATPPTAIHERLAGSPVGAFADWARVANRLADDYDLQTLSRVDKAIIDPQRAALVIALRSECGLSGVAAAAIAADARELSKWLADTPFADYGRYVEGLALSHSAAAYADQSQGMPLWSDASKAIRDAYQVPSAESLLTAPFRRAKAYEVLIAAVKSWCKDDEIRENQKKLPTDDDFGASDVFSGWADDAFHNLVAARALGPSLPSRDALLLAAAAANWDDRRDARADELRQIADGLLAAAAGASRNDAVGALSGTIQFVAGRTRLASSPADAGALPHLAGALRRLYLDHRLSEAYDAKPSSADRLKTVKSSIIDPAQAMADAAWNAYAASAASAAPNADLGAFYQAAGLLLREASVADAARLRDQRPEELAYEYLKRANRLVNDATTLIEQGRALVDLNQSAGSAADELNKLADAAVEIAKTRHAAVTLGRASALQSYARLMRARSEARTADERNKDRNDALQIINSVLETASRTRGGPPHSDYADWLIARSTINVEDAFLGDLDFSVRKERLLTAARDAELASQVEPRKHPEYAYMAWGNALEDLAYYTLENPEHNYDAAIAKFRQAVIESHPTRQDPMASGRAGSRVQLRYAAHLPAYKNWLRCRIRKSGSGVASASAAELQNVIDDATAEFGSLGDADAAAAAGIDPKFAGHIGELLYWLSDARRTLAQQAPEADRIAKLKESEANLEHAIAWARRAGAWEYWANYHCALAARKADAGNLPAAIELCNKVLAAEREQQVALPRERLYDAATLLLRYRKMQKQPLSDAEWDVLIARFPADGSLAQRFHADMLMRRVLAKDNWNDEIVRELGTLVEKLRAAYPKSEEVALLDLEWSMHRAVWHDRVAKDSTEARATLPAAVVRVAVAQEAMDELLPGGMSDQLRELKTGALSWEKLKPWQQMALAKHLAATYYPRLFFLSMTPKLITRENAPPTGDLSEAQVRARGKHALILLRPDVSKHYLPQATVEGLARDLGPASAVLLK